MCVDDEDSDEKLEEQPFVPQGESITNQEIPAISIKKDFGKKGETQKTRLDRYGNSQANLWAGGDVCASPPRIPKSPSSHADLYSDKTGSFRGDEPMILKGSLVE